MKNSCQTHRGNTAKSKKPLQISSAVSEKLGDNEGLNIKYTYKWPESCQSKNRDNTGRISVNEQGRRPKGFAGTETAQGIKVAEHLNIVCYTDQESNTFQKQKNTIAQIGCNEKGTHDSLLLREFLNSLKGNVLNDNEWATARYHISLLNKEAHPKGHKISREELVDIYDQKIRCEPQNYNTSQKDIIIAAYDRLNGNIRDVHVSKFKTNLSSGEFLDVYKSRFNKFGYVENVEICANEVHIRFAHPEAVGRIFEKNKMHVRYLDIREGTLKEHVVSVRKVEIDKDFICQL